MLARSDTPYLREEVSESNTDFMASQPTLASYGWTWSLDLRYGLYSSWSIQN